MGNWSELPKDLLSEIARRLAAGPDRVRFSGVCQNWSSLAKSEINYLPCNPAWLMLAEKPDSYVRSLVGGADVKGSFELDLPKARGNRCVGSTGCWLVMVDAAFDMYILNPFSRAMIDLPSLLDFMVEPNPNENIFDRPWPYYVEKVILSSPKSQSLEEEDFIAVAKIGDFGPLRKKLAYTKKGAKSWQTIESIHNSFDDVIFYQDKFYTVNDCGRILEFNIHRSPDEKPNTVPISDLNSDAICDQRFVVEFRGLLLQVLKFLNLDYDNEDVDAIERGGFRVFKLDFTTGGWEELNDLGQHSIFLGLNTSVSLLATSNSTFKPNCIYFTDHFLFFRVDDEDIEMGVFDLADSIIVPHCRSPRFISYFSRPVWIVPTSLSQNQ